MAESLSPSPAPVQPPAIAASMFEVSQDAFHAALAADKRDIMPSTEARDYQVWRCQRSRELFGVSTPGYASPHGTPRAYWVSRAANSKSEGGSRD